MSQQIYNFIKFLEKKEGRTPPPSAIIRYGTDEEKNDEKIQLASIEQDVRSIKYIENPTEPVQLAVVENNLLMIGYIKNPTEDVQLFVVNKNESFIKYIKNPTPKVKKVAYNNFMQRYGKVTESFKKFFN